MHGQYECGYITRGVAGCDQVAVSNTLPLDLCMMLAVERSKQRAANSTGRDILQLLQDFLPLNLSAAVLSQQIHVIICWGSE